MESKSNQIEDYRYIHITQDNIPKCFYSFNGKLHLKFSKALPLDIRFPLILDHKMARVAAMILDGCISKDHNGCMFSQKKDKSKIHEFNRIIEEVFTIQGRTSECKDTGTLRVDYSRKAFGRFLNECMDIHKSDESARIPYWVWISPNHVVREYLRYAFAMEGSVHDYLRGAEIRFHSVDLPYLHELQRLLAEKFVITSKIQSYYIKDYGWKYYLWFSNKKDIIRFGEVGFAMEPHQKRLAELIASFKNKAWEITLVNMLNLHERFTVKDVHRLFPYLNKRSVWQRLTELGALGYLTENNRIYAITDIGHRTANMLKSKVRIEPLRTKPNENEESVLAYLRYKGRGYRNEIARELRISPITIRDSLRRLIKKGEVQVCEIDKFQRRFYALAGSASSYQDSANPNL
jgi:hypothetical protein